MGNKEHSLSHTLRSILNGVKGKRKRLTRLNVFSPRIPRFHARVTFHLRHSLQQLIKAKTDRSSFESVELLVKLHSLLWKLPGVAQNFLDVTLDSIVFDPDNWT